MCLEAWDLVVSKLPIKDDCEEAREMWQPLGSALKPPRPLGIPHPTEPRKLGGLLGVMGELIEERVLMSPELCLTGECM